MTLSLLLSTASSAYLLWMLYIAPAIALLRSDAARYNADTERWKLEEDEWRMVA